MSVTSVSPSERIPHVKAIVGRSGEAGDGRLSNLRVDE
jgi:hypothetical protein